MQGSPEDAGRGSPAAGRGEALPVSDLAIAIESERRVLVRRRGHRPCERHGSWKLQAAGCGWRSGSGPGAAP